MCVYYDLCMCVLLGVLYVQVDGEEDIAAGLDLMEFTEILVQLGAWQAVVSIVSYIVCM